MSSETTTTIWYRVNVLGEIDKVQVVRESEKCIFVKQNFESNKVDRVYKISEYTTYWPIYADAVKAANEVRQENFYRQLGYLFRKNAGILADVIDAIAISHEVPKFLYDAVASIATEMSTIRERLKPIEL